MNLEGLITFNYILFFYSLIILAYLLGRYIISEIIRAWKIQKQEVKK